MWRGKCALRTNNLNTHSSGAAVAEHLQQRIWCSIVGEMGVVARSIRREHILCSGSVTWMHENAHTDTERVLRVWDRRRWSTVHGVDSIQFASEARDVRWLARYAFWPTLSSVNARLRIPHTIFSGRVVRACVCVRAVVFIYLRNINGSFLSRESVYLS